MSSVAAEETSRFLKSTQTRCPVCQHSCAGEVHLRGENPTTVWMRRTCPEHGISWGLLSSDARFYWLSKGASSGDCCGGSACRASDGQPAGLLGKNAGCSPSDTMEELSTCLALIEIVDSCNLACPVCFADSPVGASEDKLRARPLAEIQQRIQGVLSRKGQIEILQLSGGEPTLHPQLFELLRWLNDEPRILYVLINTNGVKIARDDAFLRELEAVNVRRKIQLYLQYDGPQAEGQRELRGIDLRPIKQAALERCQQINLPVTLAMTVTEANLPHVWTSVQFGQQFPNVRGISFQPMFGSGRNAIVSQRTQPLTAADLILGLIAQSSETMSVEDFTPLPCGDPNCATISYLIRLGGQWKALGKYVDLASLQDFLHDRIHYSLEDLKHCGCESEPLGELLHQLELSASDTFRLFIKPFMDAHTWDQDRIDRCCTHVIRPDGKLDSFCHYYSGFPAESCGCE